jgi:hypothetical protein
VVVNSWLCHLCEQLGELPGVPVPVEYQLWFWNKQLRYWQSGKQVVEEGLRYAVQGVAMKPL